MTRSDHLVELDGYQLGDVVILPDEAYGMPLAPHPGRTVRFFASPGRRVAARVIDLAVLSLAQLVPYVVLSLGGTAVGVLLLIAVTLLYEPVLTRFAGGTVGKVALGLRVVRAEDGTSRPMFGAGLGRWVFFYFFAWLPAPFVLQTAVAVLAGGPDELYYDGGGLLFLPFLIVGILDALWLLWDRPLRRCLHDRAAKTFVVRA